MRVENSHWNSPPGIAGNSPFYGGVCAAFSGKRKRAGYTSEPLAREPLLSGDGRRSRCAMARLKVR